MNGPDLKMIDNRIIWILKSGNTGERGGQYHNDNASKRHHKVEPSGDLPETVTQLAEPVKPYEHGDSPWSNDASEKLRDELIALKPKTSKILIRKRDKLLKDIDELNKRVDFEFDLATDNGNKPIIADALKEDNPHAIRYNELHAEMARQWDVYSALVERIKKNDAFFRTKQMNLLKKYALKIPKEHGTYILGDDIKAHMSKIGKLNFDTHEYALASDTKQIEDSVKEGLKFIDTMVPYPIPDFGVSLTDTGRPHYHHRQKNIDEKDTSKFIVTPPAIHIFPNYSEATVVHELGHHVVANDADVRFYQKHFWTQRTKDSPAVKLNTLQSNYDDDEMTRPDKFPNPYSGKFYSDGDTEIVSMGLESMYRDPSEFARKDPDYFHFIARLMWKWVR